MDSIFHSGSTQRTINSDRWYSEITKGGYRSVIFDCDGTLVDSSELHLLSFQAAVCAQGYNMDRDWYHARTGLDRQSLFGAFATDVSGQLDMELAIKQSIQEFINLSPSVTPIAETAELVRALGLSYPMAVGTNAEIEIARASLQATSLLEYFNNIVSISDGLPAKPSPDIFLQAANSLGFGFAETLVFEDSAEGVCAALDAGLDVFQLIHS